MRSTRKLLNTATSITQKSLLKPRTQWDTLSSAFATTLSILSSQKDRDQFVQTVNKGIINPSILGQADMGFFMTLALHHDLNSGYFQEHDFDVEEFIETAEPALERFQEVLYSLDREVLPDYVKEITEIMEEQDVNVLTNGNGNVTNVQELADAMGKMQGIEKVLLGQVSDWRKRAEENPEGLHGDLRAMVSDQLMDSCEMQFKQSVLHCFMNQLPRMNYTLNSGEIQNIALLSARVHEVIPESDENEEENEGSSNSNKSEPLVDDTLNGPIEQNYPIAAQIEVIYSISQEFKQKKIYIPGMDANSSDDKEQKEDSNSDSDNDNDSDEMEKEFDTAWVAVFEGMLTDGTKNSDDVLRWKLVDNRPAYEFPGFSLPR